MCAVRGSITMAQCTFSQVTGCSSIAVLRPLALPSAGDTPSPCLPTLAAVVLHNSTAGPSRRQLLKLLAEQTQRMWPIPSVG